MEGAKERGREKDDAKRRPYADNNLISVMRYDINIYLIINLHEREPHDEMT